MEMPVRIHTKALPTNLSAKKVLALSFLMAIAGVFFVSRSHATLITSRWTTACLIEGKPTYLHEIDRDDPNGGGKYNYFRDCWPSLSERSVDPYMAMQELSEMVVKNLITLEQFEKGIEQLRRQEEELSSQHRDNSLAP